MKATIQKKIQEAIKLNQLEQQLSVLKMEAVRLGISEKDFNHMIEEEKKSFNTDQLAIKEAKNKKYILWCVCIALIILEWILIFNAHPSEGEKNHLILTLIINFVTLLAVIIGAAAFFRKKNS